MPEFLQQSHTYKPDRHKVAGNYVSEKLDGTRCFWDGGLSRDYATSSIPWANLNKKVKPRATGLWSRYGNVISAPDWFLNQLPPWPLDGELWAGRGNFQLCRSIVAKDIPDPVEWEQIQYAVFDSPSLEAVFSDRALNNTNFVKKISWMETQKFIRELDPSRLAEFKSVPPKTPFNEVIAFLDIEVEGRIFLHRQVILPRDEALARTKLSEFMTSIVEQGGEGIVIRHPEGVWEPRRVRHVLKHKLVHDAEATVIGYTWGRETDKGSKLLGKMGALICEAGGKTFELSGFTDAEREIVYNGIDPSMLRKDALEFAGEPVDRVLYNNPNFPLGSQVTFTFRELSDDGIPKEARYLRRREIE